MCNDMIGHRPATRCVCLAVCRCVSSCHLVLRHVRFRCAPVAAGTVRPLRGGGWASGGQVNVSEGFAPTARWSLCWSGSVTLGGWLFWMAPVVQRDVVFVVKGSVRRWHGFWETGQQCGECNVGRCGARHGVTFRVIFEASSNFGGARSAQYVRESSAKPDIWKLQKPCT